MPTDEEIQNADELLHRQVHRTFVQDGHISSQAFRPLGDKDAISVDRDSLASPEEAYRLFTDEKELESIGTWSVTVGECEENGLSACADPVTEPVENPAHALGDVDLARIVSPRSLVPGSPGPTFFDRF